MVTVFDDGAAITQTVLAVAGGGAGGLLNSRLESLESSLSRDNERVK